MQNLEDIKLHPVGLLINRLRIEVYYVRKTHLRRN